MSISIGRKKLGTLRAVVLVSALAMVAGTASATPLKVYVKEDAIVNAGTSYLGLHPLQADGTLAAQQVWNVYVGSFDIDVAKTPSGPWQTYLAYCVDPWNWSSSAALGYYATDLATIVEPAHASYDVEQLVEHADEIEALYSRYYGGTIGNTAKSAAFQLALWEIVSDGHVDKVSGADPTIWKDGQAILSALEASDFAPGSQHYQLTAYYVDRGADGRQIVGQNYIVATAVPEPGSAALAALGLAALFKLRRRSA